MPTTYPQALRDQFEQHYRDDAQVVYIGIIQQVISNQAIPIIGLPINTNLLVNYSFIFDPFNPLGAEIRSVSQVTNVGGALVAILDQPLSRIPEVGDYIAICNTPITGLNWSLRYELQATVIDSETTAQDFFAAPVRVMDLEIATDPTALQPNTMQIDAIYLDLSGFTNGATLTLTITRSSGGTIVTTFVKSATETLMAFPPSNTPPSETPLGQYRIGPGDLIEYFLQSDNPADVAVNVHTTVFLRLA